MTTLHAGDALTVLKTLPSESVQCAITSPPYLGLRDYGVTGQVGLEDTPEAHLEALVGLFREMRRVLRPDGTFWLNYGDCYWGGKGKSGYELPHEAEARRKTGATIQRAHNVPGYRDMRPTDAKHAMYKPKDLCLMPFRLALALQQDGWLLRSCCPWVKRNPLPESAKDRPSSAVEYIFLLSKRPTYFYDGEAVRVPNTEAGIKRAACPSGNGDARYGGAFHDHSDDAVKGRRIDHPAIHPAGRNRRNSDWFFESWQGMDTDEDGNPLAFVVNPMPTKLAHFATFPPKLVEPMVKAGTSEKGCCSECGAPWRRVVANHVPVLGVDIPEATRHKNQGASSAHSKTSAIRVSHSGNWSKFKAEHPTETLRWEPSCPHDAPVKPCVVLDPFAGAGATLLVADRLGRDGVGIELNPDYLAMARERLRADSPLFAEVS
ncbi:MAG: hypothetical protein CMLOHMNK_02063 [Steroidobacteraceae bacterium]|nr:hypothetical protein [Steroidobacteraceae bacterium]